MVQKRMSSVEMKGTEQYEIPSYTPKVDDKDSGTSPHLLMSLIRLSVV